MDDLTKLSGPELADVMDLFSHVPIVQADKHMIREAARRLREDDRVWQRNLERERDGLRERLEAEMRKPIPVMKLEAGDAYVAELLRERETLRSRVTGLECTCDQLRASCTNQRKELHALNVERKATLTKLEDAQRRIAELEAQLREAAQAETLSATRKEFWDDVVARAKSDHDATQPEPAESKAQEEDRRYGRGEFKPFTLSELIDMHYDGYSGREAFLHLRETLATIDAVRSLADEMDAFNKCLFGEELVTADRMVRQLREVLNGKR